MNEEKYIVIAQDEDDSIDTHVTVCSLMENLSTLEDALSHAEEFAEDYPHYNLYICKIVKVFKETK